MKQQKLLEAESQVRIAFKHKYRRKLRVLTTDMYLPSLILPQNFLQWSCILETPFYCLPVTCNVNSCFILSFGENNRLWPKHIFVAPSAVIVSITWVYGNCKVQEDHWLTTCHWYQPTCLFLLSCPILIFFCLLLHPRQKSTEECFLVASTFNRTVEL